MSLNSMSRKVKFVVVSVDWVNLIEIISLWDRLVWEFVFFFISYVTTICSHRNQWPQSLQALQEKVDINNYDYKRIPRPDEGKSARWSFGFPSLRSQQEASKPSSMAVRVFFSFLQNMLSSWFKSSWKCKNQT